MPGIFAVSTHTNQEQDGQPPSVSGSAASFVGLSPATFATLLLLILILIATVIAYSPVLFNFFAGDDFVHLTWLKDAVKNPELIWRNFHSSWLDGTTTRFYRPLISVFMVSDYLLWKTNGLGFHLTNLAFHATSSILLFLVVQQLEVTNQPEKKPQISWWALSAAALFALYPLHPEAVSWITGRVDAIVTTFCLASLWGYISWRRTNNLLWLALAASSMILGLLSKEMAVTLPVIFFAYDFILANPRVRLNDASSPAKEPAASSTPIAEPASVKKPHAAFNLAADLGLRVVKALKPTVLFWLILGVYFIVRRIALGTFVGGYDDSLFFVANLRGFIGNWIHGLRMLFVPVNHEFLGMHHLLTKLWEAALAGTVGLAIWAVLKTSRLRAPMLFALVWLGLSLVPVYKIFIVADDLQGSRLAYVATVPLCVLLTAGLSSLIERKKVMAWLQALVGITLISVAACILWINNQAWNHAGQASNAIRLQLASLYKELPGDPQVLMIGLPDQIQGAYVCRNALWGMTKQPQMHRDISNCLMINGFEPILPFGFLKTSLQAARKEVKVYRWDSTQQVFADIVLPAENQAKSSTWSGPDLKQVVANAASSKPNSGWQADGSFAVKGPAEGRQRPEIKLNIKSACWTTDFVVITVRLLNTTAAGTKAGADLLYSNDLNPAFTLERRTHCDLQPGISNQTLIFPLRSLPDWALGGHSQGLKLFLPPACDLLIESVATVQPESLMPLTEFKNSGYLGTKGFVHLSQEENKAEIKVKVNDIKDAYGFQFEITRTNLTFENQNSQQSSSVIMHTLDRTTSDTIILKRALFPATGMYEGRAWAIDKNGKRIGVAGDHIVISVDS